MATIGHRADDPYWSEALDRYVDQRRRGWERYGRR
jgi:hypothetical protein